MAIVPRSAPDAISNSAMAEGVAARSSEGPVETFDFGGSEATSTAAAPLPVYTIPVPALAEERPSTIEDATQQGWRVLTSDSQGPQLVDVSAATGRARMVRRGRSIELLDAAGKLAEEAGGDRAYEPRIIDFGRLGLSALWLHGDDTPDLFFRLDGEPTPISVRDLLGEATQRARRHITQAEGLSAETDGTPPDLGG